MMGTAVVTGLAVVAPNGLTTEEYWAATLAGTNVIGRMTAFDPAKYPAHLAGELRGFSPDAFIPARVAVQMDRMSHIALVTTAHALQSAAADPADFGEYDMAVVMACSSGGAVFGQQALQTLWSAGPQYVGPFIAVAWFYAASTGQISIRYGMRGACGAIAAEQAGGLDAVGQARRELRRGAQLVVTGGSDASLSPGGYLAQMSAGLISTCKDPRRAYLPFTPDAAGYVPAEGGATLILEPAEAAFRRGSHIYGEIAGYGATFNPPPDTGREPGLFRAAERALADAKTTPRDVDVVFADGYGIRELDRQEAAAVCRLFGPRGVPVTVPKTMTGRMLAGGAPVDLAAALLAIRDQVIPPTVNVDELAEDCPVDLVCDEPRAVPVRTALILARGYGGFNAAMVVRAPR